MPVDTIDCAAPTGGPRVLDVRPATDPGLDPLPEPRPASTRLRRFFEPATGWFRSLERAVANYLAGHVYPRIPGRELPYRLQLDRRLTVSEATIPLPGMPDGLSGMRVLLVTDIHIGPFLAPRALERAFERLLDMRPDVVLLGGDLTTCRLEEFGPYAPVFRRLSAPLGVFAVLGNHDHYTKAPDALRRLVEETGVRFLHNDAVVLERGEGRLILSGVDDLTAGAPDLDAALAKSTGWSGPEGRPPVVLLSHNPDIFFRAAERGVSLVLSGHTHGGQIRIPGLPVLVRQSRYRLDAGRYATGGAELVVSRGLGVTGLPFRIACPPEAVLLHLVQD